MIYISNRAGKQSDSEGQSVTVQPGADVRSGSSVSENGASKIKPKGKKSRKIIVVEGQIKVG